MRYVANLDNLTAEMEKQRVTPFELSKRTGVNQSKVYSFFKDNGRPISEEIAIRIAEALKVPFAELFPSLVDKADPDESVDTAKETGVDEMGRKYKLVANDMLVGCQESVPEDGVTLRVNRVINVDNIEYSGYQLVPDEQIIIRTGVSDKNVDVNKAWVRLKSKLIEKHTLSNLTYFLVKDHELCVVVHSYGSPVMMSKGVEFAEIVFP